MRAAATAVSLCPCLLWFAIKTLMLIKKLNLNKSQMCVMCVSWGNAKYWITLVVCMHEQRCVWQTKRVSKPVNLLHHAISTCAFLALVSFFYSIVAKCAVTAACLDMRQTRYLRNAFVLNRWPVGAVQCTGLPPNVWLAGAPRSGNLCLFIVNLQVKNADLLLH